MVFGLFLYGSESFLALSQQRSRPQTSSEARKRRADVEKEIKQTEAQIKENDARVTRQLSELGKLEGEIESNTRRINSLNAQIFKLNKEVSGLEGSIDTNESELKNLREEYLESIKRMRVARKGKSDLAFIFSSKSVSQAMRRMRYLKEFSSWKARQTEEINVRLSRLLDEKDALAKAKEEYESALSSQRNANRKLSAQRDKEELLLAELRKNGRALETHLRKKQQESRELGNMVSSMIAEEQKKAAEEKQEENRQLVARRPNNKAETVVETPAKKAVTVAPKAAAPEPKKTDTQNEYAAARQRRPRSRSREESVRPAAPAGNLASAKSAPSVSSGSLTPESNGSGSFLDMKGKLPNPTTGSFAITSRFGRQYMPDMPDVEYDNPGIDAESDAGAAARAVFDGKVAGVYILPGYNTVVIVNHGGYYTVYGNISSPTVKTGEVVSAGTNLGSLALNEDGSGKSTIHFEVWKNRDKLNPQEWLR